MSFMPDTGSKVRMVDGRLAVVVSISPDGTDDRVCFEDGHEELTDAWKIAEILDDEDIEQLRQHLATSGPLPLGEVENALREAKETIARYKDAGTIEETPLMRYVRLLDELLEMRKRGLSDDESEERFAVALNDCRSEMTPEDEAKISEIIAAARERHGGRWAIPTKISVVK